MRTFYLLLIVSLLVTINVNAKIFSKEEAIAEPYKVSLLGQVESVTLNKNSASVYIIVKLKLALKNCGTTPVILLISDTSRIKTPLIPGGILTKSPTELNADNKLALEYDGLSTDTSPEWMDLRKSLDQISPPYNKVLYIMPNEAWQFEGLIDLPLPKEANKDDYFPPRESWEVVQKLSPVWLRVIYEVWPFNVEPDHSSRKLKFGHKLQRKWKPYGILLLKSILSEPIKLDLENFK